MLGQDGRKVQKQRKPVEKKLNLERQSKKSAKGRKQLELGKTRRINQNQGTGFSGGPTITDKECNGGNEFALLMIVCTI